MSKPELAEDYPLILTTGARRYTSFHSEHRQIKTLRKLTPEPFVEIHPKTAEEHGIKEGDWVIVENMFGNWRSNVNSLVPHKNVGKMGFGAPYKGIMCKIYKETD